MKIVIDLYNEKQDNHAPAYSVPEAQKVIMGSNGDYLFNHLKSAELENTEDWIKLQAEIDMLENVNWMMKYKNLKILEKEKPA